MESNIAVGCRRANAVEIPTGLGLPGGLICEPAPHAVRVRAGCADDKPVHRPKGMEVHEAVHPAQDDK